MYRKEIVYDRDTHDYAMYLDGDLVGFARSYHEAEVTLDQLVFELLSGQYFREQGGRPAPIVAQPAPEPTRTPQERLSLFTTAYRTAKAAGRDLDAARYQAEALQALADSLGMTVAQMLADRRELRAQEVA